MQWDSRWRLTIFLLVLIGWEINGALVPGPDACSDEQLKKCADNAGPLYKDAELVVPDNAKAVNKVCSLWNELASCIRSYTNRCMTRQQKSEFDKAFKDPVVSMSTLCQDQEYRKEYLHHAPCVKKISTQGSYCGNQYRYLIDLVSGGSANIKQICCARAKFRNCISEKTPGKCDARGTPFNLKNGGKKFNATTLALSTLDKSLSIVAQQCASLSTFREADCPGIEQSTWRESKKGPLVNSEFFDSAETSNNGELTQSTNFQLDQPRPSKYGSSHESTMQTPSRSNGGEKPKTDKLSSGSARSNNPQKRGSDYGKNGNGGVAFLHSSTGFYLLIPSLSILFSRVCSMEP